MKERGGPGERAEATIYREKRSLNFAYTLNDIRDKREQKND